MLSISTNSQKLLEKFLSFDKKFHAPLQRDIHNARICGTFRKLNLAQFVESFLVPTSTDVSEGTKSIGRDKDGISTLL